MISISWRRDNKRLHSIWRIAIGVHADWKNEIKNFNKWLGEGKSFCSHIKYLAPVGIQKVIVSRSLDMMERKRLKSVASKIACPGSLLHNYLFSFKGTCSCCFIFSPILFFLCHMSAHILCYDLHFTLSRGQLFLGDQEYHNLIYAWDTNNFGYSSRIISVTTFIKDLLLWYRVANSYGSF